MKIMVIPNSTYLIDKLDADAYLFPIKDYSVNYENYFEIDELEGIVKKLKNKDIFVSLNKNFTNDDIDKVKDILLKLNDFNIKGVFFYDIGIVNLKTKLKLNYDLVWSQEHMTTNYMTCNYWYDLNVGYTHISSDITLREINEIKENTKMKLIVTMFGYVPIFTSFRHIVSDYIENFKLKDNIDMGYIVKEGFKYPIVDNSLGTTVYSSYVLNGIRDLSKIDVDYVLLNSFLIPDSDYIKVVENFKNKKIFKYPNESKGFLYKDTI